MKKLFLPLTLLLAAVLVVFLWVREKSGAEFGTEDSPPYKVGVEEFREDALPIHPGKDENTETEISESEINPPNIGDLQVFAGGTQKAQFTIYPTDPYVMYETNIDLARNGNARAQYKVARALHECTGVPDKAALEQGLQTGSVSPQMAADLEFIVQTCAPLLEQIPSNELDAQYVDWMIAASEAGDRLAKSWQLIFGGGTHSADESRQILLEALKEDDPIVLFGVASYVSNQYPDAIAQEEAWMLLGCRRHEGCDQTAYLRFLRGEYQEYLVVEILRSADEIRTALDENAWASLGL